MVDFGCKYERPSSCVGCGCIEKFLKFSWRLILTTRVKWHLALQYFRHLSY